MIIVFYVSSLYGGYKGDVGYRLEDFDTKEEQIVTRSELEQRVSSGETIVGVSKKEDRYIVRTKGKLGEITLEDCAILRGKLYLLDEFDYEKNQITPSKVSYGTRKKVWWKCSEGHSYESAMIERTRGDGKSTGCPYCASQKVLLGFNDFETYCHKNNLDFLLEEWSYDENDLLPSQVLPYSNKDVQWVCPDKGHRYKARPSSRLIYNSGCPYCHSRTSFPEQSVLFYLRQAGFNVINQFKYNNKYEIDVYLSDYNIGIEYDGIAWHSSDDSIRRDEEKNKALSDAGIRLIRLRERGCSQIEGYDSEEIIVDDLDVAIRELFTLLSIKYGVLVNIDVDTNRDRQTILSEYRSSKQEKSIKVTHPHIASEWCYEKNGELKPEMFTLGCEEKVWWRCRYCNNTYRMMIGNRCRVNAGCPSCTVSTRRNVMFSDFAEIEPFWSKENPAMSEVNFSTHTKLLICCPDCGFEEKARLDQRIKSQNGLTCRQCGYHVEVRKWNTEREEFIEHQEKTKDLFESFQEFLRSQGK